MVYKLWLSKTDSINLLSNYQTMGTFEVHVLGTSHSKSYGETAFFCTSCVRYKAFNWPNFDG